MRAAGGRAARRRCRWCGAASLPSWRVACRGGLCSRGRLLRSPPSCRRVPSLSSSLPHAAATSARPASKRNELGAALRGLSRSCPPGSSGAGGCPVAQRRDLVLHPWADSPRREPPDLNPAFDRSASHHPSSPFDVCGMARDVTTRLPGGSTAPVPASVDEMLSPCVSRLPARSATVQARRSGRARPSWTMRANSSGSRLAPPTSAPSMSGSAISSAMLAALTEPPYWIRTAAAASSPDELGDARPDRRARRPGRRRPSPCGRCRSPRSARRR